MKIGITTFGGDGGKSGISQYIINLLREFPAVNKDDEFEVIGYYDEKDIFISDPDQMSVVSFGDNIRSPIPNILWHQRTLPKLCRRRNYDVLFLPAGNRRLPISVPCPTVGTVHDFSSIHVKGKYDRARMFYIKKVLPFLIKKLTWVLTVSESSKRDIVEYTKVPANRVIVTPLAANNALYHPREKKQCIANLKARMAIRSPYILYISRIEHPGKNHARLIRAFARLKEKEDIPHQLVLAGSDWGRAEEVHRIAQQSGYEKDILFTGFVKTEDVPDLYCGSDLFVFPSLYEGFGLPVLEAMSSGIPVACSDISSIPEVIGDTGILF
ncbi:MAG: glycosyltransferase family 1 protein, partial [Candidatus Electryoneaceae bacterium]|nr:glycosyltransferase family 1 protein [Candidatus Electryoneaceae bacterium]